MTTTGATSACSEAEFDSITEKHYHKKLVYDYDDGIQHYRVTYSAEKIIETFVVADAKTSVQAKSNPVLNWIVKTAGLAPSYIRMVGTVALERFGGNEVIEYIEAPACGSRCTSAWTRMCKQKAAY